MQGHAATIAVLLVHSAVSLSLIVAGAVLIAMGAIGQDTLLAMVSGAVGLVSGGGSAIALHNAVLYRESIDQAAARRA